MDPYKTNTDPKHCLVISHHYLKGTKKLDKTFGVKKFHNFVIYQTSEPKLPLQNGGFGTKNGGFISSNSVLKLNVEGAHFLTSYCETAHEHKLFVAGIFFVFC